MMQWWGGQGKGKGEGKESTSHHSLLNQGHPVLPQSSNDRVEVDPIALQQRRDHMIDGNKGSRATNACGAVDKKRCLALVQLLTSLAHFQEHLNDVLWVPTRTKRAKRFITQTMNIQVHH